MSHSNPTVGLALRGASHRSIFNIGLLEVFHEQGLPIDYIAALSSSSVVAAAYACGTLNQLREFALAFDRELMSSLLDKSASKSGVYSLDKTEEYIRTLTHNKKFEDVRPLMGFIAVDINRGEEVVLGMGDIAHAARASCTLPWLFEPAQWGNRMLIDGGVMNMIPGEVVQRAGIDIVIGVDLRNSKHVFGKPPIAIKRFYNNVRRLLLVPKAQKLWRQFAEYVTSSEFFGQYDNLDYLPGAEYPGKYEVLGRAMDLAVAAEAKHNEDSMYGCDIIIRPEFTHMPKWKRKFHLDLLDFNHPKELYELGRTTAYEYLPRIWQLMADKQKQQEQAAVELKKWT